MSVVCADHSLWPGASQRLVLSQFVQLVRLTRRRSRTHLLPTRVSQYKKAVLPQGNRAMPL